MSYNKFTATKIYFMKIESYKKELFFLESNYLNTKIYSKSHMNKDQ
jgi:hypothetical protein